METAVAQASYLISVHYVDPMEPPDSSLRHVFVMEEFAHDNLPKVRGQIEKYFSQAIAGAWQEKAGNGKK